MKVPVLVLLLCFLSTCGALAQLPERPPDDSEVGWWTARKKIDNDSRVEIAESLSELRQDLPENQWPVLDAGVDELRSEAMEVAGKLARELSITDREELFDLAYSQVYQDVKVRDILALGRSALLCERAETIHRMMTALRRPSTQGDRAGKLTKEAERIRERHDCGADTNLFRP